MREYYEGLLGQPEVFREELKDLWDQYAHTEAAVCCSKLWQGFDYREQSGERREISIWGPDPRERRPWRKAKLGKHLVMPRKH